MSNVPMGQVVNCTTSKAAPIVDTILAGLEGGRTALAVSADDGAYRNAPISREADIGFAIGFATLFTASAIYGFAVTNHCAAIMRGQGMPRYLSPGGPPPRYPSSDGPP
jgi:hypothetical protein